MKKVAIFLLVGLLITTAGVAPAAPAAKPNIVLILIDDMGYGDIGPFGATQCKTPALDRMSREGMRLTSFYAASVCSASRAQIQTGSYAPRVSIPDVLHPRSGVGLNPAEHTVAKLLKTQGYATMCVGKWHLGDQPEFLPTRYGFDHYFGIPYSNDMQRPQADTGKEVVPLMRDGQVIELMNDADQDQLNRIYTEAAVRFIREQRGNPFYLYLAHTAVHVPIHPGPEFRGRSGNGRYYDWVEETDWSVGRVLDTLRELRLETNTLVVFTSDNGPWLSKGADAGTAGPLRGGKGSTWEGGMRVPTVAWWPGQIPAGRASDAVAGQIDLLPTFVSLAGGTVPADKPIDGANISDQLRGRSEVSAREAHYFYHGYNLQAVRSGPWKLALRPQVFSMGFKEDEQRKGESKPGLRLYNLDTDIGETTDVAAAHPDVVKRLKALADKQTAALANNSPQGPGIRSPGRVKNPQFLYPVKEAANNKPKKPATGKK